MNTDIQNKISHFYLLKHTMSSESLTYSPDYSGSSKLVSLASHPDVSIKEISSDEKKKKDVFQCGHIGKKNK